MRKTILAVLVITNIFYASNSDDYKTNFQIKRDKLLKYFAGLERKSFTVALAKFATNIDVDGAIKIFDSLITEPTGDMFFMFSSIMTYLYAEEKIPDWLKQKYRNVWKNYTPFRGDTENHWVMYYTSLYLASQKWKNEDSSTWFTGKSSHENFKEAEEWINKWIEITTTIGQGEFDSPHYMPFFLIPMFMLYEFAEDSLMKLKAQMMLDLLFIDFAVEHLSNCYCGGHSREYQEEALNPKTSLISAFSALYFGDDLDFAQNLPRYEIAIYPAVTSYHLPEIIYSIATDRGISYEHRERKRVRNVIRYGVERNPAVYKYTYMTRDYCIGSLQGGILQPIQQHTWDITFSSGRSVFSVHPYFSEIELGMFFPEEVKILPELVDRAHRVYRDPDKWTSSSPYERIFQYRSSLIALYGLGEMREWERYRHVNIFIPSDVDEFEIDTLGWIVGRVGDGYFGIRVIGGVYDLSLEGICYRVRVYGDRVCVIVECGGRDEFGGFDKFREYLRGTAVYFDFGRFEVRYMNIRGFEMKFEYWGNRYINGVEYKLDWGLFDGEFLKSELKSKVIEINYKGKKRILDFNKLTIKEK
ncbi:hypothetical protein [Fervidobacterium sp.]